MEWNAFNMLEDKIKKEGNIKFEIEPYSRYEGLPTEERKMFFRDPSGNCLEFKSFKTMN